ncbi:MAG: hypothetical protein R2820_13975 [Cyclobacteriaceae bacterium]|nr:hypothetical protein [Cyclobacteriaceae bacterium]
MKNSLYLFGLVFLVMPTVLQAQEESFPCECCNTELKQLFQGKTLPSLYVHACNGPGLSLLSSSFLKAGGTAPKIIEYPNDPPDDSEYVAWTCRYSAGNLMDENPTTAWVEGVDGQGEGEVIFVPCLDLSKPVEIWAGYGKSSAVYAANSRPKRVKLIVVSAKYAGASQYGTTYSDLRAVAQQEVTLKDVNGYQTLSIPTFKRETYYWAEQEQTRDFDYFLGIEILEVYKGTKYTDTCISEVRNK